MAKRSKKRFEELTVEQKLKALFQLQTMLSKIDEIKTLRGELPLEVQDLGRRNCRSEYPYRQNQGRS